MLSYSKIQKKINRVKSKLNKDQRNLHQIDISRNFLLKNFGFKKTNNKLSENGLKRIFNFANLIKKAAHKERKKDMWNLITSDQDHLDLFEACLSSNKKKFLNLISSAGKTKLVYGYLNRFSYNDLNKNDDYKVKESMHVIDSLVSFSEFSKKIRVFCPEQGGWVVENTNYLSLLKKNFVHRKKEIKPFVSPNYAYGLRIKNRFYGVKDINGLYSAFKINNIFKNYKIDNVSEIGSGLGVVAYYVNKISRINYYIYDLPIINILQAYFLMLSLGEKKVSLFGEKKFLKNQVMILPYWEIFKRKETSKTLWFNQDSIPEIDKSLSEKYLKVIMSNKKCLFLSINQESRNFNGVGTHQHTLGDLMKNKKYKLIHRSRDFLRQGYVEELFNFK